MPARVRRLFAHLSAVATARRRLARALARDGDAARDRRQFRDAAVLYEQALKLRPGWAAVHVQAGHMFKESGDRAGAERHYEAAAAHLPHSADLALQLGHLFKLTGRLSEARAQYARALALDPATGDAARELAELDRRTGGGVPAEAADADVDAPWLAHELLPVERARPDPVTDALELHRLGRRHERTRWGMLPMLSGVEAVRGTCLSRAPMERVELLLDGAVVAAEAPEIVAGPAPGIAKAVFNLWWDCSDVAPGLHRIEVRLSGTGAFVRRRDGHVVVAPPLTEAAAPQSDAVVDADPADPRSLVEQVRARPSMVRAAGGARPDGPLRSVLVMRTDQLGDMVISVPALRRLRALLPEARIVGLVTEANAALAGTLDLFDEVIAIDFPEIAEQGKRVMDRAAQARLRDRLAPYRFDLAIDLATSHMSRPLLHLAGARHTMGFGDGDWPWMWTGADGGTHDLGNRMEATPQSGRVLWMVERLATLLDSGARVVRRADLSRERLAAFGFAADARYAVLHAGARIAFSRWGHYPALAQRLLDADPALFVVLAGIDAAALPPTLRAHPRLRLVEGLAAFDDFDALLSFCALFVGNDSGPKHLAALRGAPVVSIHSARINWGDWAQEQTGLVISRRVPCAGCALYDRPEECGRGHCCVTDITLDEVFGAATRLLERTAD